MVPVRDDGHAAEDLNSFLQSHRILAVDRRWVDQGNDSFWAICVDCHVGGETSLTNRRRARGKDYKEILSPEDFSPFAALRELRKELAGQEGIPVYTIFTNEQLTQIVQTKARSKSDLKKIEVVGVARRRSASLSRFIDQIQRRAESTSCQFPTMAEDTGAATLLTRNHKPCCP